MIKSTVFLIFFFTISLSVFAQPQEQIRDVFQKFQQGYSLRDTSVADAFVNDLFAKEIEIIGTGEEEWINGKAAAEKFFKSDWATWLNLAIDTSKINVTVHENAAFFSVPGTASISFPDKESAYRFALSRLQQIAGNQNSDQHKLLTYSAEASNLIREIESGGLTISYSIRLTGGLLQQNGHWYFDQLVFSFPYPMTRK